MAFFFWLRHSSERPEETIRRTRRTMDLMSEGKSDEEVQRILFREGVPVARAAELVRQVRGKAAGR